MTIAHYIDEKSELIKRTYFPGATDDEMELYRLICKQTGLRPEMNQIYPVKRNTKQKDGTWKEKTTFQTSIDGYRAIAERTGNYAPGKEPIYAYDKEGNLVSATAYVKKLTADGTWHEIGATAFFSEYAQRGKDGQLTQFWKEKPHIMLAKCAEALALRKAFPAILSGLYTQDEMPEIQLEPTPINVGLTEKQQAQLDVMINEDPEALPIIQKRLGLQDVYQMGPKDFDRVIGFLNRRIEERANGQATVA